MNEAEFTRMWNEGVPSREIAAHFGLNNKAQVAYCRGKLGLPPRAGDTRREMPDDFAERRMVMTFKQLKAHYRTSENAICRWNREAGIKTRVNTGRYDNSNREAKKKPKPGALRPPKPKARFWGPLTEQISGDLPSMARQHLRRFFGSVFACDIRVQESGKQTWADMENRKRSDPSRYIPESGKGCSFVSGRGVMADRDMIALARAYGFGTEMQVAA